MIKRAILRSFFANSPTIYSQHFGSVTMKDCELQIGRWPDAYVEPSPKGSQAYAVHTGSPERRFFDVQHFDIRN